MFSPCRKALLAGICLLTSASMVCRPSVWGQTMQNAKPASGALPTPPDQELPLLIAEPNGPADITASATKAREDWGDISINHSTFDVVEPVLIQHEEHGEYTRDYLRVQWRAGDSIDLFVFRPTGIARPPAILYLYSYPSDTGRFYDENWAKNAVRGGYAAVGFVSALTGQRYHSRPMKEWFVSQLQESLGSTVHDVSLILNYLDSRNDIDMDHIGMFGQGSGGSTAILAASTDKRIKAIDVLDPWGDWPDWVTYSAVLEPGDKTQFSDPGFQESVSRLDPLRYLPQLKDCNLRMEQIVVDPTTPEIARRKLADAATQRGSQVLVFPDTEAHYTAMKTAGPAGWLKTQLKPIEGSDPATGQRTPP